jgi:DNA-binding protein H-NS
MKYALFFVGLLMCFVAFCNDENSGVSPAQRSLQEQYNLLKANQEIIDGYRMMKMYVMDQFWKTVQDSLQLQNNVRKESQSHSASQAKEIENLIASLVKTEKSKEELVLRVENIVVFGKPFAKAGFITVVSFVMLGLVVLAVMLFIVNKASFITTRELRKLNESMYQEFEVYKHQAVERQIKLSRELQDYRNRLAELKSV